MDQKLLDAKMTLLADIYDNKDVWNDDETFYDDFNNVFVDKNATYLTWDDQGDDFDAAAMFETIADTVRDIESNGKKVQSTWSGYMGTDDILVCVITYK